MDNKFCSKCNSPNVTNKWGDGKYYCLFHEPIDEPMKMSQTVFQGQSFYERAKEINFLIEFYKNLSWIKKNEHEAMEEIEDENWENIQGEVLEKITKKIKKLAEEVEK